MKFQKMVWTASVVSVLLALVAAGYVYQSRWWDEAYQSHFAPYDYWLKPAFGGQPHWHKTWRDHEGNLYKVAGLLLADFGDLFVAKSECFCHAPCHHDVAMRIHVDSVAC